MTETERARKEDKVERGRAQDAQKTRKKKEKKQRKDRLKKGIRPPCYLPLWLFFFLDSRCVAVALPPRVNSFSFLGCFSGSAGRLRGVVRSFFFRLFACFKNKAQLRWKREETTRQRFFLLFFCRLVCLLLKEKKEQKGRKRYNTDGQRTESGVNSGEIPFKTDRNARS